MVYNEPGFEIRGHLEHPGAVGGNGLDGYKEQKRQDGEGALDTERVMRLERWAGANSCGLCEQPWHRTTGQTLCHFLKLESLEEEQVWWRNQRCAMFMLSLDAS